jgi:hypothetical protein
VDARGWRWRELSNRRNRSRCFPATAGFVGQARKCSKSLEPTGGLEPPTC